MERCPNCGGSSWKKLPGKVRCEFCDSEFAEDSDTFYVPESTATVAVDEPEEQDDSDVEPVYLDADDCIYDEDGETYFVAAFCMFCLGLVIASCCKSSEIGFIASLCVTGVLTLILVIIGIIEYMKRR